MCKIKCYDSAPNIKRVAAKIKAIEPKALYLHCYGNSFNLAVSDTIKVIWPISDALDHALEICKLVKYSTKI